MRQLTSLDTQILPLEDGRNHGHVSVLVICDPSTAPGGRLDAAAVRARVAERLHLLPPLRWRLAEVPFGLVYPEQAGTYGNRVSAMLVPIPTDEPDLRDRRRLRSRRRPVAAAPRAAGRTGRAAGARDAMTTIAVTGRPATSVTA